MEKTVLTANTILRDRYRIVRLLSHGGMGAVYEAMDDNLNCLVTIKETFATSDERELRRAFGREARLLANIRHPAFPKVTDYFEQGDGLFFVMDLIPGRDLADELESRGRPFAVGQVLGWADTLLAALAELHASDPPIVHKDIKPANLKLTPKGEICLLDFGLAKGAAGQMSTVHSKTYSKIHGYTPHFAPPEQIVRKGTDPRSDLYSLAATLWCLLSGTPPPDAMQRNDDIANGEPDPLRPVSELNPEVPPAVAAILNQAMTPDRKLRPASAAEMRAALREAVEAPRRARAERERREAEERIRREAEAAGRSAAEAQFSRRLDAEQAAHAAALKRIEERYVTALEGAKAKLAQTQTELARLREEHDDATRRHQGELKRLSRESDDSSRQYRGGIQELEASLALKEVSRRQSEARLSALQDEVKRLGKEKENVEEEVRRLQSLLRESERTYGAALQDKHRVIGERDRAQAATRQLSKEKAEALQISKEKADALTRRVRRYRRRSLVAAAAAVALLAVMLGAAFWLRQKLGSDVFDTLWTGNN